MPLDYSACLDDLKFILRYILVPTAAAGGGGGGGGGGYAVCCNMTII